MFDSSSIPASASGKVWHATSSWTSPLLWLGGCCVVAMVLLALPIRLSVGANYWDIVVYYDAAQRLAFGQVPHTDFFTPVGGLGYYLFAAVKTIWPQAHPILAVQWSILVIAAPCMAVILRGVDRTSRARALGLLIPFLIFGFLPINGIEAYPSSSFDAFGNYNRQSMLLLYVLVSALLFVRSPIVLATLLAVLLTALLFIKVTGVVIALVLLLFAWVCGRIGWLGLVSALAGFVFFNACIEAANGMYSEYINDIATLVSMNGNTFLPRLLGVITLKFDVVACVAALLALLTWHALSRFDALPTRRDASWIARARALLNTDPVWLAVTFIGATVFETQNTGSQEYLLVWPVLLRILCRWKTSDNKMRPVVILLIAAISLPIALHTLYRSARAVIAAGAYTPLPTTYLDRIGRASAKKELIDRAEILNAHYAQFRDSYVSLAKQNQLPSQALHAEPDFQVAWLLNVDAAARAIVAYEAANNVHFDSLLSIDFVDPFPYILDRRPVRNIAIGIDPTRTFPALQAEAMADVANVPAILVPTCPVTSFREQILDGFRPALENRRKVALTPCWDLYLPKPRS
ncbi:hypothetical protein PY365_31495 [Roseiarcaceae bacterium H3SJ34-1]|uniref:hypothetical protein n=1 Tax=Terripilifer ovatus TaxID=3032367 RepID=UPI003AB973E3|nr:hypothetical protein [Roseiarcaceae bacterium H3SJ34-1]